MQPTSADLEVTVVRYDVTKLQLAQASVPLVVLVGILARNFQTVWTVSGAFALQLLAIVLFVRARHRLGTQKLHVAGGQIKLLDSGEQLTRASVSRWTIQGTTARLYGSARSFKIAVISGQERALGAALTAAFGPSTALNRRGSPRARAIALAAGVGGLALAACAIALQNMPLFFVGVPGCIVGFATFGALSQRVAAPPARE